MQQRATAIFAVFFLLIAAGAVGLIVTAQEPPVRVDDPDFTLTEGDSFEIGGQQYTLASVSVDEESEEFTASGEITWVEADVQQTETWADGDSVSVDGDSRTVRLANESPDTVELVAEIDRAAILESDPDADNETITRNDQEFVVVETDGETQLVPAAEYFPEPDSTEYAVGDTIELDDRTVEVAEITADGATVEWSEDIERSATAEHGTEVTLGDSTYVAHVRPDGTLLLSSDLDAYERELAEVDRHTEQRNSLWAIAILSGASVVLLAGMAYMPSRY